MTNAECNDGMDLIVILSIIIGLIYLFSKGSKEKEDINDSPFHPSKLIAGNGN